MFLNKLNSFFKLYFVKSLFYYLNSVILLKIVSKLWLHSKTYTLYLNYNCKNLIFNVFDKFLGSCNKIFYNTFN